MGASIASEQSDGDTAVPMRVLLVYGSLLPGHVRLLAAPTGRPGRAAGAAEDTTLGRQHSLPSTASSNAATSQ
jgi:hypothetical protein